MSSDEPDKIKSAQNSTGRVATHASFKEKPKDSKKGEQTSVSPTVNVILPIQTGFKANTKRSNAKRKRGKSAKNRPVKPMKKLNKQNQVGKGLDMTV